jgi:hypothetical protein
MAQMFGPLFLSRLMRLAGGKEGKMYLIRNDQFPAEWREVKPRLATIAGRSVGALIKSQGFGDLYRAYLAAQTGNMDFNVAAIPANFSAPRASEFDTAYMSKLFAAGYQEARTGFPWAKTPPGYELFKR